MADSWTWTYLDDDGAERSDVGLGDTRFPTQAEAEAWLGEEWGTLADAGVAAVVLKDGDEVVYGPMKLSPAE